MGSHSNLNRSFRHTQSTFDQLLQQYISFGFTRNQVIKAWQQCGENSILFHDELIIVSNQDNAKVMNQDQLLESQFQLKNTLAKIEDEDLKKAIQLSIDYNTPNDSIQELEDQFKKENQPSGLRNIGNTCYMNIMLQYMYNLLTFRNLILQLDLKNIDSLGAKLILRLQELFALLQEGVRSYVTPLEFFEALQQYKPNTMLMKGVQNDYYELQTSFLDAIESALKEINPQIAKEFQILFYGESEEILSYSENKEKCVKVSKTSFGSINIDAQDKDLESGFAKTRLLLIDEYESDAGLKTKAQIEQNIVNPPQVLSFYINRVYYDVKQKCAGKNNSQFEFPKQLNMNEFKSSNPKAQQSSEMTKLLQEEQKCLDQLKRCGEDDEIELRDNFDKIIKLFKRSEGQIDQQLTCDDFIVCDQNAFKNEMIESNLMLKQLLLYKDSFMNRRQWLKKNFDAIQQDKKNLMSNKKNIYTLTAILIHDGSAQSGHYYCYVLDKQDQNTWWKCNDRIVTKVDFSKAYFDATGKNRVNSNVSGLIYEQLDKSPQKLKLSPKLSQFVAQDEEKLKEQIDRLKIMGKKASILYKIQQYRRPLYFNKDPFLQAIETYSQIELFLGQKLPVLQYVVCQKVVMDQINSMANTLNYPNKIEQYHKYLMENGNIVNQVIQTQYKEEQQKFLTINNQLYHFGTFIVQPQVNQDNFEAILIQTSIACNIFKPIDSNLFNNFSFLHQALLLKGCFICDLLIQKQKEKQAVKIAQLVIQSRKNSVYIPNEITQQIAANVKKTVEQMEYLKISRDTISEIRQNSEIQINANSICQSDNKVKNLNETLLRFNSLLKSLEVFIQYLNSYGCNLLFRFKRQESQLIKKKDLIKKWYYILNDKQNIKQMPKYCLEHKGQEISLICFLSTCSNHLACIQCLIDNHSDHHDQCQFIDEIIENGVQNECDFEIKQTVNGLSEKQEIQNQILEDFKEIQEQILMKLDMFQMDVLQNYNNMVSEELKAKQSDFLQLYNKYTDGSYINSEYLKFVNGEQELESFNKNINNYLSDPSKEKLKANLFEGYNYLKQNSLKLKGTDIKEIQQTIAETIKEIPKALQFEQSMNFVIITGQKSSIENGNCLNISNQDTQLSMASTTQFSFPNKYVITMKVDEYDTQISQQILVGFAHYSKVMNYNYFYKQGTSAYFGISNQTRVNFAHQKPEGRIIGDAIRLALKEKQSVQIQFILDLPNKSFILKYGEIQIEYSKRKCSKITQGGEMQLEQFFNKSKKYVMFITGSYGQMKCQVY